MSAAHRALILSHSHVCILICAGEKTGSARPDAGSTPYACGYIGGWDHNSLFLASV
jgi:hypothetical protein